MRLSVPIFRLKREARVLAREAEIPLHQALDRIARRHDFRSWSHLSAAASQDRPAARLLSELSPGDLVLLGARPGQGKTLLGLELAALAAQAGRTGWVFTLEFTAAEVEACLRTIGLEAGSAGNGFVVDTSDEICAEHIIGRLRGAPRGAVAVIDYLQLLDQRRRNPELGEQVRALRAFAEAAGVVIIAISQIDRAFEAGDGRMPDLKDVRLPNPLDLGLFTRTCFLHGGEARLEAVA